jgi:hypothetical protein
MHEQSAWFGRLPHRAQGLALKNALQGKRDKPLVPINVKRAWTLTLSFLEDKKKNHGQ